MEMIVKRNYHPDGTPGEMFINDEHECYTLELPKGDGYPGSCIPEGTYEVYLTPSSKFSADDGFVALCASLNVPVLIPRIIRIPNRSLIDIHWGNTEANTDGCVLVGETEDAVKEFIGASRPAFARLYLKIVQAVNSGGCLITLEEV